MLSSSVGAGLPLLSGRWRAWSSLGAGAPLQHGRWRARRPAAPLVVAAKGGKQQAQTLKLLKGKGLSAGVEVSVLSEPGHPEVFVPGLPAEAQQALRHPAPQLRSPLLWRPPSTQALAVIEARAA